MKLDHPWKCDGCGVIKQPSNNWLIMEVGEGYAAAVSVPMKRIAIWKWDEILAEQAGVNHVCGQKCMIDQLSKLFNGLGIEKLKVEAEREIR